MRTAAESSLLGLVLAGGRSRRMGRDKARLSIDGTSALERTVTLLRAFCDEVRVAVRADQAKDPLRSRFPLRVDPPGDLGPLGAILESLRAAGNRGLLVCACDLPRLDCDTLAHLVAARDRSRAATAYDGFKGPEPLCAIWEPSALPALEEALERSELSPRRLLQDLPLKLIEAPDPKALSNANHPGDWPEPD